MTDDCLELFRKPLSWKLLKRTTYNCSNADLLYTISLRWGIFYFFRIILSLSLSLSLFLVLSLCLPLATDNIIAVCGASKRHSTYRFRVIECIIYMTSKQRRIRYTLVIFKLERCIRSELLQCLWRQSKCFIWICEACQ